MRSRPLVLEESLLAYEEYLLRNMGPQGTYGHYSQGSFGARLRDAMISLDKKGYVKIVSETEETLRGAIRARPSWQEPHVRDHAQRPRLVARTSKSSEPVGGEPLQEETLAAMREQHDTTH